MITKTYAKTGETGSRDNPFAASFETQMNGKCFPVVARMRGFGNVMMSLMNSRKGLNSIDIIIFYNETISN